MGKYDGQKCIACNESFKDTDDIVVCPDCGTPYHRECWLREGSCINESLHLEGGFWKPEHERAASASADGEGIRCARCGHENPPDGLFCKRCGLPLTMETLNEPREFNDNPEQSSTPRGNTQSSFGNNMFEGNPTGSAGFGAQGPMRFDQNSDIDGVKLGDYARYVGKNQFSFLAHFIRFGKFGGKASLNFCALLFPQYWFFYRKMNLIGTIYLLLTVALSIPTIMVMSFAGYLPSISFVTESLVKSSNFSMILNATSSALMVLQCVAAIFANYWYYKTARKKIMTIRESSGFSEDTSEGDEAAVTQITKAGGVSFPAFLLSVLISNTLVIAAVFIMNKLM
ncbi:MAG: DUF2628 domain-containing protein [Ruminococcus sp.]|nr:DUF2628 domain-containing protein [Ruminococcus sp.]